MSFLHQLSANILRPVMTFMSRSRLPQVDGRLRLDGLQQPVTIHRDEWGIPHIYAQSRPDLFFAQGFVHAQERLWQMEVNRRTGSGRLAEMLGPPALEVDRLSRTLGFRRLAAACWPLLSEQLQADAVAYAAGVNGYLASGAPLPLEFRLLRHQPEPWEPLDSLAFGRVMLWALSHGWAGELVRARLQQRLPPELAAELEPEYPLGNPLTLPDGIELNEAVVDRMLGAGPLSGQGPLLGRGRLEGGGRGSNGWVIAPERSATGHAILANDMHLPLTTPSLWYFWHLHGPDGAGGRLHLAGVSQPGLPYVLVGHNERIAWGATLAFTDGEDLFIEALHPSGDGRYRFGDGWRTATIHEERIRVKGADDHLERVVVTHHGPFIGHLLPGAAAATGAAPASGDQHALALCAVALQPDRAFDGFAALNAAANWDQFVDAVALISSPPLNLLYADAGGNIGHYVSGRVPLRAQGDGLLPAPGYSGDHEWSGFVPFDEMPHAFNPARGYIITANNRIVGDDYPYNLGRSYMNGYRARRLEQLIGGAERISLEDCQRFQADRLCLPGLALAEAYAGLASDEPDAALGMELLRSWDGRLEADSVGGTVYQFIRGRLTAIILGQALGDDLLPFLGRGPHPILYPISDFYGHWTPTLLRMLANPDSGWLGARIGREAVLLRAAGEAVAELRQRLGPAPAAWQWGRLHQLTFDHLMAEQTPLDQLLSQGPFPLGGDTDTVAQAAVAPGEDYSAICFGASYRQIIDLGQLAGRSGHSRAMYAPGQSGHLASPHYGDLIEPWLDGRYFPIHWTEAQVLAARRSTLELVVK